MSKPSKPSYTTILVPVELRDKVKELALRENKSQWKILEEAIGLYYTQKKRPKIKEALPIHDKVIWYIIKVSMSVGAFKENPTAENLSKLEKTVNQIAQRLKWVPYNTASLLLKTAKIYLDSDDQSRKKASGEVNMALKMMVTDILSIPEDIEELEEE